MGQPSKNLALDGQPINLDLDGQPSRDLDKQLSRKLDGQSSKHLDLGGQPSRNPLHLNLYI